MVSSSRGSRYVQVIELVLGFLGDLIEAAVLGVKVERRQPVVALVIFDVGRRTGAGLGLLEIHGQGKSIGTKDGMDVGANAARKEDWVCSFDAESFASVLHKVQAIEVDRRGDRGLEHAG
jgi:hypothetical protein